MNILSENDLTFIGRFLHAFKALGGNELGLVDYDRIKSVLKQKNGMSDQEIVQLLDYERCVKDGKLDYISLCVSILSTKALFNHITSQNGRVVKAGQRVNTRTFTKKKGHVHNLPNNELTGKNLSPKKLCSQCLKGCLFNSEPGSLIGNRYKLEVFEFSSLQIFVKPLKQDGIVTAVPIEILLFQENEFRNKILLNVSSERNQEGYCSISAKLKKGHYVIVPILVNWRQEADASEPSEEQPMTIFDESGQSVITGPCQNALKIVYDYIDLDGNGLLSQLEFDLFIQHISGVTTDDEWSTVEDNFTTEDHQLTLQGFLELYKMALDTDPDDVKSMFHKMGFTGFLQPQNAQSFVLVVKSEAGNLRLTPLPITSYSNMADKAIRKITVEQGSSSKVKNMNDLILYTHKLPYRISIVIQNQSHSKVVVRLDCTESENCQSYRGNLDYSVEVPPRSCVVGHHLFVVDELQPMKLECREYLK